MTNTMGDTQNKNKRNITKPLLGMFPSLVKVIMLFIFITEKIPPRNQNNSYNFNWMKHFNQKVESLPATKHMADWPVFLKWG